MQSSFLLVSTRHPRRGYNCVLAGLRPCQESLFPSLPHLYSFLLYQNDFFRNFRESRIETTESCALPAWSSIYPSRSHFHLGTLSCGFSWFLLTVVPVSICQQCASFLYMSTMTPCLNWGWLIHASTAGAQLRRTQVSLLCSLQKFQT